MGLAAVLDALRRMQTGNHSFGHPSNHGLGHLLDGMYNLSASFGTSFYSMIRLNR